MAGVQTCPHAGGQNEGGACKEGEVMEAKGQRGRREISRSSEGPAGDQGSSSAPGVRQERGGQLDPPRGAVWPSGCAEGKEVEDTMLAKE